MKDITNCLIVEPEIQYCIPRNRDGHRAIEEQLRQYGLYPGLIHVWEHEEQLIVVGGFTVVEKCMSFQVDGKLTPIPICEEHIIFHKFADIVEAKYWRACHMMARPHMTKVQRCKAWLEIKPVFEEIGLRKMFEAGKRKRPSNEPPWDTTKKLESTFRMAKRTVEMYKDVMTRGTIQLRTQMENEDISITAAYNTLHPSPKPPKKKRTTKSAAAAKKPTTPVDPEGKSLEELVDEPVEDAGEAVSWEIIGGGAEFVSYVNHTFTVAAILPVITDTKTRTISFVAFSEPVALKNQFEVCGEGETVEDVVNRVLEVSHE